MANNDLPSLDLPFDLWEEALYTSVQYEDRVLPPLPRPRRAPAVGLESILPTFTLEGLLSELSWLNPLPEPLPTPAPVIDSAESSPTAMPEARPNVQQRQQQQQQQQNLTAAAVVTGTATAQEAVKATIDGFKGKNGSERNEQREKAGMSRRGRPRKDAPTDPEGAKARKERKAPYPKKGPNGGAGKTGSHGGI